MSSAKPKLYVESLAEVAPNIFGPNVAVEKAATRRNRQPLRFNERTYFQKFGWANAPATTGSIVPEGYERQPGHAWYNVLQPNKKSVTTRFLPGDPRRSPEAIAEMVNPHYRSNLANSTSRLSYGMLRNTPYGLRMNNLTAKTAKRALGSAIVRASQSQYAAPGNLAAAIEARRVQGETNLQAAQSAALEVAQEEAARDAKAAKKAAKAAANGNEPSGNAGGASARKRRTRRNRRRTTRRRR